MYNRCAILMAMWLIAFTPTVGGQASEICKSIGPQSQSNAGNTSLCGYRVDALTEGGSECYSEYRTVDPDGNGHYETKIYTFLDTDAYARWDATALSDATWTAAARASAGPNDDSYGPISQTDLTDGWGAPASTSYSWDADEFPGRIVRGDYSASMTVTATASALDPTHPEWAGSTDSDASTLPRTEGACISGANFRY